MSDKVRVRYAPSPTGYLHIGGARSALFNYLFAKRNNGTFVLRIEDTDVERNIEGADISQIRDLEWLGIYADESPEKPNPKYGAYRQMDKLDIYHMYAQKLLDLGLAYECYCSEEELEQSRDRQLAAGISSPRYDGHCLHLSEEEKKAYIASGRKPAIRIKMPKHESIEFDDLVRGHIKFDSDEIGDWVIMKSNGIPTYNFAVVVDDHMMEITHVLRGEEHLSNTPKQIQIYKYLGWKEPIFGHMTIIINENGKKLSKRDNNIVQFISQYREKGYLPQAIVNFLLLLGWTSPDSNEFFTLEEASKVFDITRLSSSPSMFDQRKLLFMNSHYIKQLNEEDYYTFMLPFIKENKHLVSLSKEKVEEVLDCFKGELKYGEEIEELLKPIFEPSVITDGESLTFVNSESGKKVISLFASKLKDLSSLDADSVKALIKEVGVESSTKGKDLYMPLRLKLTSQNHGIEMFNIIKIIGKEETIRRLLD